MGTFDGEVGQEGEGEVEGQREVELESEGKREQISQEIEVEVGDQREEESGARGSDSDAKDDCSQRIVTSRRRDVVESGSEENHFDKNDGVEVDAARSLSRSPIDKYKTHELHSALEIRDVFGDFDDEKEDMGYADNEQDSNRYSCGEQNIEMETKDKPLGSSLELEIPLRKPPALPNKKIYMLNVQYGILVSVALHNLFCSKKYCSWSGNPAITRKVIEESEIYAIFLVLKFSSVVDSRQRKIYKSHLHYVSNTIIQPYHFLAESQTIRANVILNRKCGKVNQKYAPIERRRQLSPGFLEDAVGEDAEADYFDSRCKQRHFEDELEAEVQAEKRIMNAKKSQRPKDIPRKSSFPPAKSSRDPVGYPDDRGRNTSFT
ncbi:uncharacterized protein LOC131659454 [Vicia villosa]|uniref:uncharacterized protein LOC131659454 n=1 Tax=Vicia villosa TaxID=3911 RepID=UPI00273AA9F9|nr:uncharacterized protein LOC131659454 [Vicia villosa]